MAVDVDGITQGLGSSVEQVALPFDATERTQMTMRTTHNVVKDNVIQLSCCPLVLLLVRSSGFLPPTMSYVHTISYVHDVRRRTCNIRHRIVYRTCDVVRAIYNIVRVIYRI